MLSFFFDVLLKKLASAPMSEGLRVTTAVVVVVGFPVVVVVRGLTDDPSLPASLPASLPDLLLGLLVVVVVVVGVSHPPGKVAHAGSS